MNILIYSSLAFITSLLIYPHTINPNDLTQDTDPNPWQKRAIQWLLISQSEDGGWGNGSNDLEYNVEVRTDPGTTAFVGLALIQARGDIKKQQYKKSILGARNYILKALDKASQRRVFSLDEISWPYTPGISTSESVGNFLMEIKKQFNDAIYKIEYNDGEYVVTLFSNAEEEFHDVKIKSNSVDTIAVQNRNMTQSSPANTNYFIDGIRITPQVEEMDGTVLSAVVVKDYPVREVEADNASSGGHNILTGTLNLSQVSSVEGNINPTLQFSGEEYIDHNLNSERLFNDNRNEWLQWRTTMEKDFIASQNPNGSWTGHHCFSSPAICTASVLLAWYADN